MQLPLSERPFTYCVWYSRRTALSYDSQSVSIREFIHQLCGLSFKNYNKWLGWFWNKRIVTVRLFFFLDAGPSNWAAIFNFLSFSFAFGVPAVTGRLFCYPSPPILLFCFIAEAKVLPVGLILALNALYSSGHRRFSPCENFPFCTYLQNQSFCWLHLPSLLASPVASFPNTHNHEWAPPYLLKNASIWDLLSVFYFCLWNKYSSHIFKLYFTTVKI